MMRNRKRKRLWLTALPPLLLLTGCGGHNSTAHGNTSNSLGLVPSGPPSVTTATLTGMPVNRNPYFAVMIENSPEARPQTGLAEADLVYETEAEGTITRYIAFFHDHIPKDIGPVRSARPYFVSLAQQWAAPYVHFGGSTEADNLLKSYPYPQIDGIYEEGKYFHRDSSRQAPHNAYLITSKLPNFKLLPNNTHFTWGPPSANSTDGTSVSLSFNSFTNVKYVYDPKSQSYVRYQQGKPQADRDTGKVVHANNVIIQYTSYALEADKYHLIIQTTGTGKCVYFSDGKKETGTWSVVNGQLEYSDTSGKEITLQKGTTWVELIDNNVKVGS